MLSTDPGVTAVDAGTTHKVWNDDGAVSALDGSAVFTRGAGTLVRLDPRTGESLSSWPIDATLNPIVVAPGGKWVALTDASGDYNPDQPRGSTRLVVVDGTSGQELHRLDVVGDVEPEAFSPDGERLVVLDHRGAIYRVQWLELASGERYDTIDENKNPVGDMTGHRVRGVLSEDDQLLATLYQDPGNAEEPAFVHVLALGGWTYCVDLPAPFGSGADGTELIERAGDTVAVISEQFDQRAEFSLKDLQNHGSEAVQLTISPHAGPRADATYVTVPGYRALIAVL